MIILLYGKDTYRSKEKMGEIIVEYKKKYKSGLNLKFLEGEDASNLEDYDRQVSMFNEKKLIVLRKLFSSEKVKSNFLKNFKKIISSDNIFILYEEGDIKKSDNLFKKLSGESKKSAMLQEFQPLSGRALFSWIKKEFNKNSIKVDEDAIRRLQEATGEDLWRIKNEIDKLSLYKKEIKEKDVDYMVNIGVEANIFKTIDAIAEKKKEKALLSLYDHLEKGDNPLYILSMITYQFRNLITVSDLSQRKFSYNEMKAKSGLHPFVFKKSYNQMQKFSFEELKKIYDNLFEMDLKAKTGQIDPVLALHLFLF